MLEATLSPREVIGFYKGCILKYIWREHDKGGWYDLQKAEVYARRMNEFCARIGLSGDVPHDVSISCASDTDRVPRTLSEPYQSFQRIAVFVRSTYNVARGCAAVS